MDVSHRSPQIFAYLVQAPPLFSFVVGEGPHTALGCGPAPAGFVESPEEPLYGSALCLGRKILSLPGRNALHRVRECQSSSVSLASLQL